jgi:hypothetical protein
MGTRCESHVTGSLTTELQIPFRHAVSRSLMATSWKRAASPLTPDVELAGEFIRYRLSLLEGPGGDQLMTESGEINWPRTEMEDFMRIRGISLDDV